MPFLFLSPSTQTYNEYRTEGNEQLWMNRLADRMVPYLNASGINVTRNDPGGSAAQSIRDSNAGSYDFHLALHSNASPEALAGRQRGVDLYYYPTSEAGLRMASLLADNIRPIYPLPERVQPRPTTAIGEVRRTHAPSVLAELGYHDNAEDEAWLVSDLDALAAVLSLSVAEYFGVPFLMPSEPVRAVVRLESGFLNLRSLPSTDAPVLAQMSNGQGILILGQSDGWYTVNYNGLIGFARSEYIGAPEPGSPEGR